MEYLVIGTRWEAVQWQQAIENCSEHHRCRTASSCGEAFACMARCPAEAIILCPGHAADELLEQLLQSPPLPAPWLIGDGWQHPALDACCTLGAAAQVPAQLETLEDAMHMPRLAALQLSRLTGRAERLLQALDMQPRLGAWVFLPQMLALCTVHPSLLADVTRRLYPLCGIPCGLSAACVERRLRLAVESTWNRSRLDALERYFGQTVDPQRGKPTNKEFLARLCIYLAQQANKKDG